MWTREFESQAYGGLAHRYERLHLIDADEFIFYRFVNFDERMYGKTVSELHAGNLRTPSLDSRYAKLFPNHRLSYWSGSCQTALEETLKHGGTQDHLIFKAYDDGSSTFPTGPYKPLKIIDGRDKSINNGQDMGIGEIIREFEKTQELSDAEALLMQEIMAEQPDAIVYNSVIDGGENFIFFESGFDKLSLREVDLYLGDRKRADVVCACGSDYSPSCEAYGYSFERIARTKMHEDYRKTVEYKRRLAGYKNSLARMGS